jgi:hypothetical protein
LQYGRQFIFGFVQGGFEFGFINQRQGFLVSCTSLFFGCFTRFPEFQQDGKILDGCFNCLIQLQPVLIYFDVFENGGGPLVIFPES